MPSNSNPDKKGIWQKLVTGLAIGFLIYLVAYLGIVGYIKLSGGKVENFCHSDLLGKSFQEVASLAVHDGLIPKHQGDLVRVNESNQHRGHTCDVSFKEGKVVKSDKLFLF